MDKVTPEINVLTVAQLRAALTNLPDDGMVFSLGSAIQVTDPTGEDELLQINLE